MTIADNIKRLRKNYNMSQEDLAKIAGVTVSAVSTWELGKREPRMGAIQKIADHFGLKKSDIIEDKISLSPPVSEEFTQEDKNLVYAYHNAPRNAQQVVDLTLEPYKPTDIETKVRQIAELLATIDISCTYTDDNGEGKGNFVSMYLKSYKQDGKRIQVNDPILHIDPLESTYERLLPAMRASGSLQQELLDKYLKERFDVELALIKETPYISNNTLINVSKSVVEKRQERDKKDGVVKNGKVGDEVEFEAVK